MNAWREALVSALFLIFISWAVVQCGVYFGGHYVPAGGGIAPSRASEDLFRFDAVYYLSIARDGYSYNRDPYSSPNIVFAPLFPMLVRAANWITGVDFVTVGFALNKILLFLALTFLSLTLRDVAGRAETFFVLLALVTAAGAYSLHAYYSESTMLFFLSLCLLSYQRKWWMTLALAAALLGASRLAALPVAGIFAAFLLSEALRSFRSPLRAGALLVYSLLCVSGAAAYLGYIYMEYGNPLTLIPEIQGASWGLFHQPVFLTELLSGGYFISYWEAAFNRGFTDFFDIKTINLLWTSLAGISIGFLIYGLRGHVWTYVFLVYFLFIYATNSGSDYLISAHRFFVVMLPIYMMFAGLHGWVARKISPYLAFALSALLLLINAAYGVILSGYFNQGVWYYF